MDKYIDLHVHSTASDGTYTPSELVKYAVEKKLSAFAITDHDNIDGVEEAVREGAKFGIEVIPGIELSAVYTLDKKYFLHILGLDIDYKSGEIEKRVAAVVKARKDRFPEIISELNKKGINIIMEDIEIKTGDRVDIGIALMKKGFVKTIPEAFQLHIADSVIPYSKEEILTPEEAIEMILQSKGIPVLAHPLTRLGLLGLSVNEFEDQVKYLASKGLMGLEAYHSEQTSEATEVIIDIAKRNNLLISGGSDFHGSNKVNVDMGVAFGDVRIKYELLEKLKEAAQKAG